MGNLSEQWKTLHRFVKPVTDADLLHIPLPLVELLNDQASKLPKSGGESNDCRAVILPGTSLGYFKRQHASIRDAIDAMGRLFKKAKIIARPFPENLGLIVLPFTSTRQLFQNTILYHELGEFVYDEGLVELELHSRLDPLVSETSSLGCAFQKMSLADRERVVSWARELYSDLFAVYLIGPVFTFASTDYCELANDQHDHWAGTHPPDDVRMLEQIRVLSRLNWWKFLKQRCAGAFDSLRDSYHQRLKKRREWESNEESQRASATKGSGTTQAVTFKDQKLLFGYLKATIRKLAYERTIGVQIPKPSDSIWDAIAKCLQHGIVPSAVLGRKTVTTLEPTVLLNAGYFFARDRLSELFNITKNRNVDDVGDRAWAQSRVEEWTLKAIDDVLHWPCSPAPASITSTERDSGQPGAVLAWKPLQRDWNTADPVDIDTVVVTPVFWPGLDEDSLDLRLGPRFVLSRPHRIPFVDFGQKGAKKEHLMELLRSQEVIHIPKREEEKVTIPPHGSILGVTLEFIKLPYNVSGQVLTKSSLARRFITIETAPWIHPLFRGCLTLEIANASDVAVQLGVGDPIAQLVLFTVANVPRPDRDSIDKYGGPTYPELEPGTSSGD